jgi:DNA mismatch endonuclease, patch repair protein
MKESAEQRSRIMRAVKSRNTGPETAVRRIAHRLGYRFRSHRKDLPGRPDLVFPARRKVIFVHGCFWHRHDCARGSRRPKSNTEYWRKKIRRNYLRDKANIAALKKRGWRAAVVWECELKEPAKVANRLARFLCRTCSARSHAHHGPTPSGVG